jgi:mannitol/fructose-specific phosphotransferase system IIA component (Ntr-type)
MDLDDYLGPNPLIIDLQSENRLDAINELINYLANRGMVAAENKQEIIKAIKYRETAMSTGIGFGIGIPHAVTESVSGVTAVIGRSKRGIDFAASDGKPVHLIFLFLVPQGQFQKHVNTLANLAKLMHTPSIRDGLWGRFM